MAVQDIIIDFNKICRLCLMEESVMSSIYNEADKHSSAVPLPLRIMACVSIELNSIDGLPSQICTTCLCQVDGWYKFKDLCESADAVLKKCLKNEPVQAETVSKIRSKAKEIRQFFASPHLVKVENLDFSLNQSKTSEEPMEFTVKKEDEIALPPPIVTQKYLVYLSPDTYFKWLQCKYKLSNKITLKEKRKKSENDPSNYEITFNSYIEKPAKKLRKERLVMEVGDCQLLEVGPVVDDFPLVADDKILDPHDSDVIEAEKGEDLNEENWKTTAAVANYEKTKEYLESTLRERNNIHEEIIENVLYSFRLDEDGQIDVINIVEGISESHFPQRGFRYTCLFCSEIVINKLVYDKHIRDYHLRFLICKVCDKQLYSLRNFLIHTKTHLGVYTFTCPLCGKGLTRASIFKSHIMYHYYGKIQKCEICEKKFRDIFALRRHVQLHDKKIEYVCELCGFGTHLKSNLEYHLRAHGDEKSYMCELCGKQFMAPQSLQHHMKTHEPNFPCPHCKRTFRHENKFQNHLEQSHTEFIEILEKDDDDDDDDDNVNVDHNDGGAKKRKYYTKRYILKDVEKANVDGVKLYKSRHRTSSEGSKEEIFKAEIFEDENSETALSSAGDLSHENGRLNKCLRDNETLAGRLKPTSDLEISPDFSSDDDLPLSSRKKKMLLEKNGSNRPKTRKKILKKPTDTVKYLRTVQTQTEWEDDASLEVIETKAEEGSLERKKTKSRKTQTPKEQSGGKKRFRIRPAIPSSCTLCDKVYKNSEILRQHIKSHHVTGTIECPSCKLTFSSLRSLKYHDQRKHSNLEPVPCTFCGKKFLDKKYLRIHENIHSQANHFVCQFCGRKFIMKTNLTVHISRHHTKKSNDFICQICGKAFPFKLYLKKHFKTHTDYKPYQCTYCEAKFRENTLLRKHVNSIHLKLRPFLCQYCHKTFTRGLYLREHMESQHLGIQREVECSRCGETFQNRNRLRQHECLGRMEIVRIE